MTGIEANDKVIKMAKLEYKPLREVWPNEAQNFTPWLLDNSDYLAEALGLDIELDVSEHPIGAFSVDIFGRDVTHGCPLIVENQLENTDHRHLGQLLTYAAGADAKTVVWISASFRDEHRQALEFLNDLAGDTARFFGVEVQVAFIAGSPLAPILNVVVEPSDWKARIRSQRVSTAASLSQVGYRSFWGQYLETIHESHPGLTKVKSPQGTNWMNLMSPRKGIFVTSSFLQSGKLTCELYIDVRPRERNRNIYEAILLQRVQIEKDLGTELLWDPMEGRQACRLKLEHEAAIGDETGWPILIDWLSKWQVAFTRVIVPIVRSLDESYWTDPLTE